MGPLTLVPRPPVPGVGPEMLQDPATDMAGVSLTAGTLGPPARAMVGVLPGSVCWWEVDGERELYAHGVYLPEWCVCGHVYHAVRTLHAPCSGGGAQRGCSTHRRLRSSCSSRSVDRARGAVTRRTLLLGPATQAHVRLPGGICTDEEMN